jgi:hypothetical protein
MFVSCTFKKGVALFLREQDVKSEEKKTGKQINTNQKLSFVNDILRNIKVKALRAEIKSFAY